MNILQIIFGENFVNNNINNINLIINGKKSPLVPRYDLEEEENNVTICIKNTLTNLSFMFFQCDTLFNIEELKYLNTENVYDFSFMFEFTKISNIKALENWETSKAETFHSMFCCCYSLSDIKPLKNWNGTNFNRIFAHNWLLSDIKILENWDVSNAIDLGGLFERCPNLTDIIPIQNWNLSKL